MSESRIGPSEITLPPRRMAVGPISDFGTFPSSMRIIVFRRELLTIDPLDLLRVFRDGFFARAALCLASAAFCLYTSARNDMKCEHGRRCSGSAKKEPAVRGGSAPWPIRLHRLVPSPGAGECVGHLQVQNLGVVPNREPSIVRLGDLWCGESPTASRPCAVGDPDGRTHGLPIHCVVRPPN